MTIYRNNRPSVDSKSGSVSLGMADSDFIRYVGDPDLHDGRIVRIRYADDGLLVTVAGASGHEVRIHFRSVHSVKVNRPEGMLLYALAEMKSDPPKRRFVFTNWDDEDEACLDIVAEDVHFAVGKNDP